MCNKQKEELAELEKYYTDKIRYLNMRLRDEEVKGYIMSYITPEYNKYSEIADNMIEKNGLMKALKIARNTQEAVSK